MDPNASTASPPEYCFAAIQHWSTCLDKAGWASWVQAVGSIGAILFALWLARREHRETISREARQHAQRMTELFTFPLSFCERAQEVLGSHMTQLEDVSVLVTSKRIESAVAELLQLEGLAERVTAHLLPSLDAMNELYSLRNEVIQMGQTLRSCWDSRPYAPLSQAQINLLTDHLKALLESQSTLHDELDRLSE